MFYITLGCLSENMHTVFTRSDAVATIYFTARSCAATIRERRLLIIRRERNTLGTCEEEEAGPFEDIDDGHELDENELVLEDC